MRKGNRVTFGKLEWQERLLRYCAVTAAEMSEVALFSAGNEQSFHKTIFNEHVCW